MIIWSLFTAWQIFLKNAVIFCLVCNKFMSIFMKTSDTVLYFSVCLSVPYKVYALSVCVIINQLFGYANHNNETKLTVQAQQWRCLLIIQTCHVISIMSVPWELYSLSAMLSTVRLSVPCRPGASAFARSSLRIATVKSTKNI